MHLLFLLAEATILQIADLKDLEGNIIKEWNSATEAARELGIDCSKILVACHKSYKGFLWEFKEKESIQDNINKSFNI